MAALVSGMFAASFFVASQSTGLDGTAVIVRRDLEGPYRAFSADDLVGTWKGSWGRNAGDCTIQITWVEGEAFFGTLKKEGAEIHFHGTFNPASRAMFFDETKVVRLGAEMSQWSLGENRGSISRDGRMMFGTGVDEWGQYSWAVSGHQ
ncbi:hypothetical protein BH20ACI2_BH20ACI2_10960 [soil metagenome]